MISAMPANTPTARNTAMSNTFISVLDLDNLPDNQRPERYANQRTVNQFVTGFSLEQWSRIAWPDEIQENERDERQCYQDSPGHSTLGCMHTHLLLQRDSRSQHRCCLIQQLGKIASGLPLHQNCGY